MVYRTKTYLAADWEHDIDAIEKLEEWNTSSYLSLSFIDAHRDIQARDTSYNCSIKASLKKRMDESKTFILIVGEKTNELTHGGCQLCKSYNSYGKYCANGYSIDYRSFIKYECDKAVEAGIKIIVLYKYYQVHREKCPESIRYIGKHIPIYTSDNGRTIWDYSSVKDALEE